MRFAQLLMLALAMCLSSSHRAFADFVIDTWQATQSVSVDGVIVGSTGGTTTGTGIFGDGRGYSLQTLAVGESMTVAANTLKLTVNPLGPVYEGKFLLNYIDSTPSESLTAANINGLVLSEVVSNAAWKVTINFKGTPGSSISSYTTTIPANNNETLAIPFTSFTGTPIGSLGLISEVGLIFTVDSTIAPAPAVAPQLSLKYVAVTAVPEPSSVLLGSLVLSGLAARRFRRRPISPKSAARLRLPK